MKNFNLFSNQQYFIHNLLTKNIMIQSFLKLKYFFSITILVLVGCGVSSVQKQATTTQQPLTYINAPYAKLCSESFVGDYAGKAVSFKTIFIGEWTITQAYSSGIKTEGRVFLNHRDASYRAEETALGSTDLSLPGFALSIEKGKSDIVYELKRGDIIEIKGVCEEAAMPGKIGLHIIINEIRKVTEK